MADLKLGSSPLRGDRWLRIRKSQQNDTKQIARLIFKTFQKYNGREYFVKGTIRRYLDQYDLNKKSVKRLYDEFKQIPLTYVAVDGKHVVGVIRGSKNRIGNLFVSGDHHRKGIGRKLVEVFERRARRTASHQIKVRSTIYATPFYQSVGYRKTTGIRNFYGHKMQPMKKDL